MSRPPFVMAKYANINDLNKDKAAYYEHMATVVATNANNPNLTDKQFRELVLTLFPEFPPESSYDHDGFF